MNWNLWWIFTTASVVLDMVPGPAVLLVIGTSLRHGARPAARTIVGILSTNAFYFAISATSLGALWVAFYEAFFVVKWLGAAYLVYLGLRALLARESVLDKSASASSGRLYMDGIATQIANPKALVYFAAFVPLFIDPAYPAAPQLAILGATSTFFEFFVLLAYASLAGRASVFLRRPHHGAWVNRIAGGVLAAAGAGMALVQR
jgi:homoserine/homoserine lactone efflux protein